MIKESKQEKTGRNKKIGPVLVQFEKPKLSKTHQDYWLSRLQKRTYTDKEGKAKTVSDYMVRIFYKGQYSRFNLGTANKTQAAIKARDIYVFLKANGWDETHVKYKPKAKKVIKTTVGEFIKEVEESTSISPKTLNNYIVAFRRIVSQIENIDSDKSKYDHKNGGRKRWLKKIHNVKLSKLTPGKIQKWKIAFIKNAGNDPIKTQQAKRSANSLIRCSRALFSSKTVLPYIQDVELPSPLPFEGIQMEKEGDMRYKSEIDPEWLIAAARTDLSTKRNKPLLIPVENRKRPKEIDGDLLPELYKIFLLCLLAGLRREEADKLLWDQIDFSSNTIRIEATRYYQPKSEKSQGEVFIDPELSKILMEYRNSSKSKFVLSSDIKPRTDTKYRHYRCNHHFEMLILWLKSKGVNYSKPIHALRKEFGSLIAEKHGIYAASRALRHADITITAKHYLDTKQMHSVGLGNLLTANNLNFISA